MEKFEREEAVLQCSDAKRWLDCVALQVTRKGYNLICVERVQTHKMSNYPLLSTLAAILSPPNS